MLRFVILNFVFQTSPVRVVFGAGRLQQLAQEADGLDIARALVLCTPRRRELAEAVVSRLRVQAAGIFDQATMHVPVELARAARAEADRIGADGCVAIGGGSTVGLAKAIALESGLPIIAVPTTYSGSEMTLIWGLTEGGLKRTGRDPRVLPRTVIYDPGLTLDLPASVSGPSGMNAMAHCVEVLYAANANPIISLMAEQGIRSLAESLPVVVAHPVTWRPAPRRSTGPASPAASPSITSCVTSSAAASTYPTPRPTPSSCPMPPPSTARPRRTPWRSSPAPWVRVPHPPAFTTWQPGSGPGWRSRTSA